MALKTLFSGNPTPAPGGAATATVTEQGKEPHALPPIVRPPTFPHLGGTPLVPLETGLSWKVGQSGVYSSFEVNVRCVDLHVAGDLAARTELFHQQVAWAFWAMDLQAQRFNAARKALGQSGDWIPSGAAAPAPSTLQPVTPLGPSKNLKGGAPWPP